MNFLSKWFSKTEAVAEKRSFESPNIPLRDIWNAYYGGVGTEAGIAVSPRTAHQLSIVHSCVVTIAGRMASMRHDVKRHTSSGVEVVANHQITRLFNNPNDYYTGHAYRMAACAQPLTWGNSYSGIDRRDPKRWKLILLDPAACYPVVTNGVLKYEASVNSVGHTFEPYEIFHLKGLTHNGLVGISPITEHARTLGKSIAAEVYAAKFFKNSCHLQGVLTHPQKLSTQATQNLKAGFQGEHQGVENAHKMAILEEGMKFIPLSVAPEAAQMLETMAYTDKQIASQIFRVPLHLVGLETGGDPEQNGIDFVRFCLSDWLHGFEAEVNSKLLTEREKDDGYFFEFDTSSLTRGDMKSRMEAYSIGRQIGLYSVNDIRRMEHLPPDPSTGADALLTPLNMVSVDQIKEQPDGTTAPTQDNTPKNNPNTLARMVEDSARRVITKEIKACQRAAKKFLKDSNDPESFKTWSNEFYTSHREIINQSLGAAVETSSGDIEEFTNQHIKESRKDLALALWSDNPTEAVEEMLTSWQSRPAKITAALLN